MEIVLATVADAATISGGKLNIIGVFDTMQSASFPVVVQAFSLAFRLRAEYTDSDREYPIEVVLEDADGGQLWGAGLVSTIGAIPPGEFIHLDQVVAFRDLPFASPGRYRFRIRIADDPPYFVVFQLAAVTPAA